MTTAGEAAALFGTDDSAADLFSLGAETDQAGGPDPFAQQELHPATDLFGSAVLEDLTFVSQNEASGQQSYEYVGTDGSWDAHTAQYAPNSYAETTAHPGEYANTYAQQSASQAYSSQQGQWAGYEPQQYNPPVNDLYSGSSSGQYAAHNPSNAYVPPAPANASAYGSYAPATYGSYTNTTNAPAHATHDPYKPLQTAQHSAYGSTASNPSAYDPYKPSLPPSQPASNSSVTLGQYGYPQTTSVASVLVPSVDPPQSHPAVTADAFRPKTSNAYDPPLPPPKPTARRTPAPTWPAPGISNPQTAYTSPTNPPLRGPPSAGLPPPPQRPPSMPPPPPRSRSTVSDYDPYSASHLSHNHASPPPPRAAPPSTFSPPLTSLRTAVSPPPRTPPVRQYTPLQQTGYAYTSNGPARGYSPAPRDVPLGTQAATSAPHVAHGIDTTKERFVSHKPAHDLPNKYVTPAPITHTSGEGTTLPTIPAAEETDDPEGGVFEGDDFWDREEQGEATEKYGPTSTEDSTTKMPSVSERPVVSPPRGHDAGGIAPGIGVEANVSPLITRSPEETRTHSPAPISEPLAASATERVTKSSPESIYDPYNPHHANANQSPSRTQTPDRAKSPGNASIRSWSSSQRYSLDQDRSTVSVGPYTPPTRQSTKDSVSAPVYDPYAPAAHRAASPSTFSVRSVGSTHSQLSRDPYAPGTTSGPSSIRNRSESNGSMLSYGATNAEDPYAPSRHRQSSVESSSYRSFSTLQKYADAAANVSTGPSQVVTLSAPAQTVYAPSPSLLGTNDPLGRASARVPVISFGFGGKLVTCFHGSSALNTGFDIAMSSRASSVVHMRPLYTAIPQSALETSSATFPGPLFSDPASQATTLVRTGVATQTKNKKAKVVQYLEERAEEISQGLGYLHQGSVEGFRAEAKLVMIKVLKTMVENDGRLSGSPQIENAVRSALLPDLDSSPDSPTEALHVPALASSSYPSHGSATSDDTVVTTNTLWSSQLSKIQRHLLRGDRRLAYQYAADERLWAHAMVIASSVDKEAWKEVVTEFLRSELSATGAAPLAPGAAGSQTTGREPLKVAYSLFAGQGPASVQELLPPRPLASLQSLQVLATATSGTVTPMSASFPPTLPPLQLPKNVLAKWKETAGMILSGVVSTESSSALTAFGDQLVANGWVEAGHVCYLLSPQTSPVGGVGFPTGRVVLYGSPNPQLTPNFWKDADPIIFSEIVEFALSLSAPVKGQEAFAGIPHLQPYRFIRAAYLAELGYMDLANRYCDAISNSLSRPSPYLNAVFGEQLKGLVDRLTAAPVTDKTGSWKMARPSLDKIGGWLERGFTNFIAGEGDSPKPVQTNGKEPTFSGPFTHFSEISTTVSAASSTISSPQMSTTNLTEIPAAPPFRTGSAMALRPPSGSANQIARASSAIDYLRRKPSPVPRISSASATNSSFGDLASRGQIQPPYGYPYGQLDVTPRADQGSLLSEVEGEQEGSLETPSGPQIASWWSDATTPTASSFAHPEPSNEAAAEGFVSLMDSNSYSPAPVQRTQSSSYLDDVDEEDYLGLGNSAIRAKAKAETHPEQSQAKSAAESKTAESSPTEADKSAGASGGWFSRLWKRGDPTPGPVKANLGEQSAFYYDKELKRWVNKNSGPEAAGPSPAPPPPRAQTASPGMSMPRTQGPPARPATASIDLTDGPPKKPPMRIRSNLVPSEVASAPTTPAGTGPPRTPSSSMDPPGLDGPPTAGARAKAGAKRNARSRYVDVFQHEGA